MKADLGQATTNVGFKVCTACGQQKNLQEFHRFGKNGERIGKWCEACLQRQKRRRSAKQA